MEKVILENNLAEFSLNLQNQFGNKEALDFLNKLGILLEIIGYRK